MDPTKLPIPGYITTAFLFFLLACAAIVVRWVMKKLNVLEELSTEKLKKLDHLPDKDWFLKLGKLEEDLPDREWFKKREEVEEEILRKLPEPRRIARHYSLIRKLHEITAAQELEIKNLKEQIKVLNTKVFGV